MASKKPRLTNLQRGSYASVRALERILCDVKKNGVPEAVGRSTFYRARKKAASEVTPFGALIQPFDLPLADGVHTVVAQHPLAMLHVVARDCEPFRNTLEQALRRKPPSAEAPWGLVMYCDEIGHNPVGRDERKIESVYWSFLELGPAALSTELAWFEVVAVRTTLIEELPSGMSHLYKLILSRLFFNREQGSDMSVGVFLRDGWPMIFAKFACFVADEKAIKEVWCNKGASGYRFCPLCWNVCTHKASAAKRAGQVLGTCTDSSQFAPHTDRSIRELLREAQDVRVQWENGVITKEKYKNTLLYYGWNAEEFNVLEDAQLNIGAVSTLMHCWVHIYLVNGIFNSEVQFLLIFLHAQNIPSTVLDAFFKPWTWPRSMKEPRHAFGRKRVDFDADHYKCDAAEGLRIYNLVAIFLRTMVPPGVCALQVASFLALCKVLDALVNIKYGLTDHDYLHACVMAHLIAFQAAYGVVGWLPKHHLATHLARQLRGFGLLLNLLTHERKHKVIKRWSKDRFGKQGFEQGLMEELALEHIHAMQSDWCSVGLLDACAPRKKLLALMQEMFPDGEDFLTARKARVVHGNVVLAGDVAFAAIDGVRSLAQVEFHLQVDGVPKSCVNVMVAAPSVSDIAGETETWRHARDARVVPLDWIVGPATHLRKGDLITAVVPTFLR